MNFYINEDYFYKILNNSSGSSSNSSSASNSDNSLLFFKVWRNQYLKYQIINQLQTFRMVYDFSSNSKITFDLKTLCNFKLKEYLLDIHLRDSCKVGYGGGGGGSSISSKAKTQYNQDDVGFYYSDIDDLLPWCIPQTTHTLKLDLKSNSIKRGTLPNSITSLTIDSNNQLEVGSIPNSVKKLVFRNQFDNNGKPLTPALIPDSVEQLYVYSVNIYQKFDPFVLPSSIHTLAFSKLDFPLCKSSIPPSVTSLELSFEQNHEIGAIPDSVTSLVINNSIEYLKSDSIPNSVENLVFENYDNSMLPLHCIPSSVKSLMLSNSFNHPINSTIFKDFQNSTLNSIVFGSRFNNTISPGSIPSSTKSIKFGFHYNQEIGEDVIPEGVECIEFNYKYNKNICNLPNSVLKITLGYCFDQAITPKALPQNLKHLELGYSFNNKLSSSILPESLDTLIISKNYTHSIDNLKTIINFIQSK